MNKKIEINSFFKPINSNEEIITICNNEERKWSTRNEARQYFYDKYIKSPMAERENYGNVLFWILRGKLICSDQIR